MPNFQAGQPKNLIHSWEMLTLQNLNIKFTRSVVYQIH